jgi:DeoR/GlpR family transcriptional regulator of sugar metabolism
MIGHERKALLLQRLKEEGRIVAKDVARELQLSEDSIRRDLRELAAERLLKRVHGGALPLSPTVASLTSRRRMAVKEKTQLAAIAMKLLKPGQTVFLDGGTTHVEVVRALPLDFKCTIITHSPEIAVALEFHEGIEVVLVGGRLYRHSMVTTGVAALQAINSVQPDLFFVGATGVQRDEGLTTGDFEEAQIKRAILNRSGDTYCIVTQDKVGAASPHKIAGLNELSGLVTFESAKTEQLKGSVRMIYAHA